LFGDRIVEFNVKHQTAKCDVVRWCLSCVKLRVLHTSQKCTYMLEVCYNSTAGSSTTHLL